MEHICKTISASYFSIIIITVVKQVSISFHDFNIIQYNLEREEKIYAEVFQSRRLFISCSIIPNKMFNQVNFFT